MSNGVEQEQDINKLEWWKKTNFYHIYIRSFNDSDGDGEGDLRGIIEKLDYLEEIGIGTLLLSPFYSSPMKDVGYDIDDYLKVNHRFGTMDDFDELISGLKKRGIRLVVDFVPNHTSDKHLWFQYSERALIEPEKCGKYKDYYVWSSSTRFEGKYPSNWISVFGGGTAWQWSPIREQFYLHQFLPEQPDLNLRNPLVREELKEVVRFWLRKGADGIRVDAVMHMMENIDDDFPDEPVNPDWTPANDPYNRLLHTQTHGLAESAALVRDWHEVVEEPEFGGDRIIITEGYGPIPKVLEYHGTKPDNVYAEMPFNFELLNLTEANMKPKSVEKLVCDWLNEVQNLTWKWEHGTIDPWSCWVSGNHDNSRIINKVGLNNSEIFRWISYMAPGVPVNYYGDEIAIHDSNFVDIPKKTVEEGELTRLVFRAPMAWNANEPNGDFSSSSDIWMAMNRDYKENNVETMLKSKSRNHLRNFIKLQKIRREKASLFAFADLVFFPTGQPESMILAMGRTHNKFGNLLLIANLNSKQREKLTLSPAQSQFENKIQEPASKGRVLLLNKAGENLVEDLEIDLENLVLEPSQALLISNW